MARQLREGVEADLSVPMDELQMGEGGDMLIDDIDPVDEKPDVAIITPDDSTEDAEPELQADDCTFQFDQNPPSQSRLTCEQMRL